MKTIRYFSEELQQAKEKSTSPLYAIRAPWVWQILVSCAGTCTSRKKPCTQCRQC